MKQRVVNWYFNKLITALKRADIRFEKDPIKLKGMAKRDVVGGYCVWTGGKYQIVIRDCPSRINELYVIIHEGLHAAFPKIPEQDSWGEPVDMFARTLLFLFSTNQLKELERFLVRGSKLKPQKLWRS